jgi:hypothetical protein
MAHEYLESGLFESLTPENHQPTSPPDPNYNCIAWAAGCNDSFWWPYSYELVPYFWPLGPQDDDSLDHFIECFTSLGFEVCEDPSFVEGYIKLAIYIGEDGKPTHMARQLPDERSWTSKLGEYEDIAHSDLSAMECNLYGKVGCILQKCIG